MQLKSTIAMREPKEDGSNGVRVKFAPFTDLPDWAEEILVEQMKAGRDLSAVLVDEANIVAAEEPEEAAAEEVVEEAPKKKPAKKPAKKAAAKKKK